MKPFLVLLVLVFLSSCGIKSKPSARSQKSVDHLNEDSLEEKTNLAHQETYIAHLEPINPDRSGFISGAVSLKIEGDVFISNVRFNSEQVSTFHIQSIHDGSFCPTEIADANGDGVIDITETLPYTSKVLIPLDGDLSSQIAGNDYTPMSDPWGTYVYSTITSYSTMMNDLYSPDENPEDEFSKLILNSPLNLDERVVVIYGINDLETLPIACGVFSKVETFPGVMEPDDITVGTVGSPTPTVGRSNTPHTSPRTTTSNGPHTRTNGGSSNRSRPGPSEECAREKVCH